MYEVRLLCKYTYLVYLKFQVEFYISRNEFFNCFGLFSFFPSVFGLISFLSLSLILCLLFYHSVTDSIGVSWERKREKEKRVLFLSNTSNKSSRKIIFRSEFEKKPLLSRNIWNSRNKCAEIIWIRTLAGVLVIDKTKRCALILNRHCHAMIMAKKTLKEQG